MQYYGLGPQNRFSFTEYINGGTNSNTAKLWGCIVDKGGATNNDRPACDAIKLVNKSVIGDMYSCPVTGAGSTFNFAANPNNGDGNQWAAYYGTPALSNVPLVYVFCFKSGNSRSIVLVNSDFTAHTVALAGNNVPTGTVTTRQLAPSSLDLLNEAHTGTATNKTAMATTVTSSSSPASNTVSLPPYSLTALDYSASSTSSAAPTPPALIDAIVH
jgi:hypothetical protein